MSILYAHPVMVPDLMGLAFLAYLYATRFAGINGLWDDIERLMPRWLTYQRWGNPITWLHHTMTAVGFACVGGALVWLNAGSFAMGFMHWSFGVALGYVLREAFNWDYHAKKGTEDMWSLKRGWKTDGIMDVVGPLLVVFLAMMMVM